jgi:hypothetical protein
MLHITRILAILLGVILLLVGVLYVVLMVYMIDYNCSAYVNYCGANIAAAISGGVVAIVFAVIAVFFYIETHEIENLMNQRQFEAAKEKTLIWMIIGFFAGILPGILLLIAYLKFDPVINWSRGMGTYGGQPQLAAPQPAPQYGQLAAPQAAPAYAPQPAYQPQPAAPQAAPAYAPQPTYQPPQAAPAAPAPAPAAAAPPYTPPPPAPAPTPAAPACPTCQKPATFIAQYNRYYCFSCSKYV